MKMKLKGNLINIEIDRDYVTGITTITAAFRDTDISMEEITGNMFPDKIDCTLSWKKKDAEPEGFPIHVTTYSDLDRLHKKW